MKGIGSHVQIISEIKYLALASLGVSPVLVSHLAGDAHQVGLHDGVLDGLKTLLLDVGLLAVGGNDIASNGSTAPAQSKRLT